MRRDTMQLLKEGAMAGGSNAKFFSGPKTHVIFFEKPGDFILAFGHAVKDLCDNEGEDSVYAFIADVAGRLMEVDPATGNFVVL